MDYYYELHLRGLTRSRRHFSQRWLGMAPNYLSLRGERELGRRAFKTLSSRLWREGHPILAARVAWASIRAEGARRRGPA